MQVKQSMCQKHSDMRTAPFPASESSIGSLHAVQIISPSASRATTGDAAADDDAQDDARECVGALLTGIFAAPMLGGFGEVENIGLQLWIQFKGVLFTVVYTGIVTYLILKAIDLVIGLRVNEEQETIGLDLSLHNERGYNL